MIEEEKEQEFPGPAPSGFEVEIARHLRILGSRLWLIALVTAVSAGLGFGYLQISPKVYRAAGSILIEPELPRVLGDATDTVSFDKKAIDPSLNSEYVETQYRILTSRDVLNRVVGKLHLDRDLEFLGLKAGEAMEGVRAEKKNRKRAVQILKQRVKVAPVRDSQLTEVLVDDTDPERAAEIANQVVDSYLQSNLDRRLQATRSARAWLAEQMGDLKEKLETSELALFTFRKQNDILATSVEDRLNLISLRLTSLTNSLANATARRVELEAQVGELEHTRATAHDSAWPLQVRRVAADPTVLDLQRQLARTEGEAIHASERYLDLHPTKIATDTKLASLKVRMSRAMSDSVAALRGEYREALMVEANLANLVERTKQEAFEVNRKEIEQRKLQRDQDNNQRLFDLVLSRLKDADLAMLMQADNIKVLDVAEAPDRPVSPRPAMVLVIATTLGACLGVGLAYASAGKRA
ncbi:MAG TPA: GumC family protein [Vulgatibacter sp.]